MPAMSMWSMALTRSRKAGRSAGSMPSRRSPRSTMATTACRRPAAAAAFSSATTVSSSLSSETSVSWTVSPASSGGGARSSQMGAVRPASRRRWAFSRRESPSALAPPASIARPTCGEPQVTLVTATTEMPGRWSTTVRALSRTLPRSTVTVALAGMSLPCIRRMQKGIAARRARKRGEPFAARPRQDESRPGGRRDSAVSAGRPGTSRWCGCRRPVRAPG